MRERHAAGFGPTIVPQGGKYAWFGTDLVLDAFTFLFRETEHGLFQVHSYPFDEHTSTFIVECQEPTWRAATCGCLRLDCCGGGSCLGGAGGALPGS